MAHVLGLYLAQLQNMMKSDSRTLAVRSWVIALLVWPLFYLGIGFVFPQHPLIQLVGLRAAIWFVPFILIGTQLTKEDLRVMAIAAASLNIFAFAFAVAEFFLGVEMFYPRNAVTEIIYMSKDVADHTAFRIPATFTNPASYGGYLAASFPLLISRLAGRDATTGEKSLMVVGLICAMLGVFMCGSRTPVLTMTFMFMISGVLLRGRLEIVILMIGVTSFVAWQVLQDERLQRVSSLADTDMALDRVSGSARLGILDVIADYPFGVGLGGAVGTSIPSFLAGYTPIQVGAENELAHIGLEQSVISVFMWLGFLAWIVRKRIHEGSSMALVLFTAYITYAWITCIIGAGLLTSIPHTAMLLIYMGVAAVSRKQSPVPTTLHPQAN